MGQGSIGGGAFRSVAEQLTTRDREEIEELAASMAELEEAVTELVRTERIAEKLPVVLLGDRVLRHGQNVIARLLRVAKEQELNALVERVSNEMKR